MQANFTFVIWLIGFMEKIESEILWLHKLSHNAQNIGVVEKMFQLIFEQV